MNVGTTIGARLKKARLDAGLSHDEAGAKCGVTGGTVYCLEIERNRPTLDIAIKLCEAYGADIDKIAYGDDTSGDAGETVSRELRSESATKNMTIGERLLFCRTRRGLTQKDVAERIMVSRDSVRSWEKDRHGIHLEEAGGLCKVYGISLKALLHGASV